jgi:hypothetical protein
MYVKFVSDIDYMFNPVSGEFDIPAVEWEEDYYGKNWVSYESEEARSKALAENQAYNETPEVKAYIAECESATDRQMAYYDTLDLFEYKLEKFEKVELSQAIQYVPPFRRNGGTISHLAKLVGEHNKQILKVKIPPKRAMFTLGDLF